MSDSPYEAGQTENGQLIPYRKIATEKGTSLLVGNTSNRDFLDLRITRLTMSCAERFLSEPTSINNPETALIPAQSCTLSPQTSMLSRQ